MRAVRVWLTVWITCLVATGALDAGGQQPQRYNETVNVDSVLIDVRVLDEFGRAVVGLNADDFSVRIGGQRVRVQSSSWIGVQAPAPEAPGPSTRIATAIPANPGRLMVLLFQRSLTNEHAYGLIRKVAESRDLVRSLGPSDHVAVLTFDTSLRVWTDFTSDHAKLDSILAHGILSGRPPTAEASPAPSLLAHLDQNTGRRTYTMESAFELIAHALEPLPGSKTIAFFGHGMGQINRDGEWSAGKGYENAQRTLIAARAAVFSLDITKADSHSLAAGLGRISEETGGFYASSLDFPERATRWLAEAISGYYVLFVDKPAKVDASRELAVSLTRRQARVFATRTANP
jgi:VWFA-related protein